MRIRKVASEVGGVVPGHGWGWRACDTMGKIFLIALLLAAPPAFAEWVAVGRNSSFTTYANPADLHRQGGLVKMWSLTDFNQANTTIDAEEYRSIKVQYEYDCPQQQSRLLEYDLYAGHMGAGKEIVSKSGVGTWRAVDPGGVIGSLWKVACGSQ